MQLYNVTKIVTNNLNKVIDINFYPTPKTKVSNFKHRHIGIGVQGLADTFALMNQPFICKKSKQLNKDIFETIYYAALESSMEIAQKEGHYETFKGSPASKGILQFDMWNVEPSDMWDWDKLRSNIIKYGTRNSLLTTVGEEIKKRKKTRQGNGRGTKFSTRVGSKRFKKRTRGQGKRR